MLLPPLSAAVGAAFKCLAVVVVVIDAGDCAVPLPPLLLQAPALVIAGPSPLARDAGVATTSCLGVPVGVGEGVVGLSIPSGLTYCDAADAGGSSRL